MGRLTTRLRCIGPRGGSDIPLSTLTAFCVNSFALVSAFLGAFLVSIGNFDPFGNGHYWPDLLTLTGCGIALLSLVRFWRSMALTGRLLAAPLAVANGFVFLFAAVHLVHLVT